MARTKQRQLPEDLRSFLDSYDARLVSIYTSPSPTVAVGEVRTYLIGHHVVIVTFGEHAWDIYVPVCEDNDVAATLKAAEKFLGPRPGDLHLAEAQS